MIFSLQQLLPGDPALVMAGEEKDPEVIEQIRRQYRLDQPVPIQYLYWIKGVFTGDLGKSCASRRRCCELILQKLPVTLQLATMAMVIALLIGVTRGRGVGGEEGHVDGTTPSTCSRCGAFRRRISGSGS